ncbi:hypothetical protein [Streptomyces litchfieldiae]|uniref:Uncharacterized protein n=1 Tax=Streptomyces litchfieldiae TaxID=3075543 RepID=A0ABU2MWG7_9ACTN|nr:hypothetical protein [Streptomyces sp. DSM 44938]MDT0345992.1 hypothetical protein [Streptomyces sp. DSM 44938]
MPDVVELSVDHVVSADGDSVVCVVRSLSGAAAPGISLTVAGADPGAVLRLDWIKRYERLVDLLDPPHNAKIALTGPAAAAVTAGARLVTTPDF